MEEQAAVRFQSAWYRADGYAILLTRVINEKCCLGKDKKRCLEQPPGGKRVYGKCWRGSTFEQQFWNVPIQEYEDGSQYFELWLNARWTYQRSNTGGKGARDPPVILVTVRAKDFDPDFEMDMREKYRESVEDSEDAEDAEDTEDAEDAEEAAAAEAAEAPAAKAESEAEEVVNQV